MRFEELSRLVIEAFDPSVYNLTKGSMPVSLLVGRFNPWHKGHNELALQTQNDYIVVGLVKGQSSQTDKERNPFDFKTQKEIILKANHELNKKGKHIIDIIEIPSANIPQIISTLRNKGYEPEELLCGVDRAPAYLRQISNYAPQIGSNMKLKVLERDEEATDVTGISATKVRQAIRDDDYLKAKDMMVNLDKTTFDILYNQITQNIFLKN